MSANLPEALDIKNVVAFEKGKPPTQQPYFGADAEIYLTPEYLRGRGGSELVRAEVNSIRVSDGDTIVLWDGSNAGEVLKARKGVLSSTMMRLKHDDTFDREYFFYAVKKWEPFLKGQTSGSGIPHVDKEILGRLQVLNFPQLEQIKIAEVLTTLDQAIKKTEALIAKQHRIKTGLMQDLLTRGIDERGNLRSQQTHKFKDSPVGWIPVEWKVLSLKFALKKAQGFLQTGPFGSQLHAHEYTHEGIPVIMPQDIIAEGISTDSIARVPEHRANALRRHRVQPNDVVFSRRGDLSRAAAISEGEAGWLCGTGCFLVRLPTKAIEAKWLADVYRHHRVQSQVYANAVGSTMPSLNNNVMEHLKIAFPSLREQQEIARCREAIDAVIRSLTGHLQKLKNVEIGLMQDLLSGKRRVSPLFRQ